ncbi:redox-sensing transcriptional repressor Rex [Nocardia uniformis]|uniref:Redox-sensing transcriptional repressor Rex n=1 Tax=Nocardia uniformis TaxID=53432 RepID=A0A849C9Y4_9NOCA|nr:redox-sensing transcriptional repressor Rex [Nocardia uniformis]NNH75444.1 redox-sensing transcriptional repressor Rex [Nocardia uniformis]
MTEQHETPSGVSGRALQKDIPQATVARLATYLRVLAVLADEGTAIVSSEELAVAAGVGSAKLRKDLSFLGPNGVRGVGYDVIKLRDRIEDVLGLSGGHRVVLVGAGNLGRALVGYGGFRRRGFGMVGLFDNDPEVIGTSVCGLVVRDVAELAEAVATLEPTIAVITVPDATAQSVCDLLVAAGMQSILSFSPVALDAPDAVEVRRVDLAVEMQLLSFELARSAELEAADREVAAGAESIRAESMRDGVGAETVHAASDGSRVVPTRLGRTATQNGAACPATRQVTPIQTSHAAMEPTKGSVVTP